MKITKTELKEMIKESVKEVLKEGINKEVILKKTKKLEVFIPRGKEWQSQGMMTLNDDVTGEVLHEPQDNRIFIRLNGFKNDYHCIYKNESEMNRFWTEH